MSQAKQVLAGAIAGAVTSFVLVSVAAPKLSVPQSSVMPPPVQLATTPLRAPSSAGDPGVRTQLSALEQRLRSVEDRAAPSARTEAPVDQEVDPLTAAGPTPDEFIANHYESYQQQPIDPIWAPIAEAKLEQELAQFAGELGYAFSEVECRGDACVATVEFPSYEKAKAHAGGLVNLPLSVNCEMGATVPEPNDPSASYAVQVFLTRCIKQAT